MKRGLIVAAFSCLLMLAGCGNSTVQAASGTTVITATLTLSSGTVIAAGSCITLGATVAGATSTMGVVVTPAGDPQPAGLLFPMLFTGFVDAADHVTVKVCKVASPNITTTSDVILNIKAIS